MTVTEQKRQQRADQGFRALMVDLQTEVRYQDWLAGHHRCAHRAWRIIILTGLIGHLGLLTMLSATGATTAIWAISVVTAMAVTAACLDEAFKKHPEQAAHATARRNQSDLLAIETAEAWRSSRRQTAGPDEAERRLDELHRRADLIGSAAEYPRKRGRRLDRIRERARQEAVADVSARWPNEMDTEVDT